MDSHVEDGPTLLANKFAAIALLLFGFIVLGIGIAYNYAPLIVVGGVLMAGGLALLVLKIMRRNRER